MQDAFYKVQVYESFYYHRVCRYLVSTRNIVYIKCKYRKDVFKATHYNDDTSLQRTQMVKQMLFIARPQSWKKDCDYTWSDVTALHN